MMLHKLIHHPEGVDPLTTLASLLNETGAYEGGTLVIAWSSPNDPLPAVWGRGIKHFLSLDDPVKAVEFAGLIHNSVLAILGDQYSAIFSGSLEKAETVFIEKLFTGSSPEYHELLEDTFPAMLSETIKKLGVDLSSVECVTASLPSQRLGRRLPRYLTEVPSEAFRYIEEGRKSGLGHVDMAAYTLGKCLSDGSRRTLFVGLSEWGILTALPRWSE